MVENDLMALLDTTIVYISRYYAPSRAAAGLRAERSVKALIQAGVRVLVLTEGPRAGVERPDANLTVVRMGPAGQLPAEVSTERHRPWPGWRILPGPDPAVRFAAGVYQAGQWALEHYPSLAIVVSGPPFSLMAVGCQLSRARGVPLILEFRDAWYTGMFWPYRNGLRRRMARTWERECVRQASRIITVTAACRQILAEAYGEETAGRIEVIRHGYEPSSTWNFAEAKQNDRDVLLEKTGFGRPSSPEGKRFILAYTGQLRGIDVADMGRGRRILQQADHLARRITCGARFCENLIMEWMSPDRLIAGLGRLAEKSPDFRRDLRLIFCGQPYEQIDRWTQRANLGGKVFQLGCLPAGQAREILLGADVLILMLYGIKNSEYHWCVPSKVYDYLSTGKPILNLAPAGEVNDIVNRAGVAYNARPDDTEEIAGVIEGLYQQHRAGGIAVRPDWEYIRQFEIARQQEKFIQVVLETAHQETAAL